MSPLSIILLAVLISFTSRVIPRLWIKNIITGDTFEAVGRYHNIKNTNWIEANKHNKSRPLLVYFLFSLIPEKYFRYFERLSGAFFDTLQVILLSVICLHAEKLGIDTSSIYLPILLIAAISPVHLSAGTGPGPYFLGPREPAEFFAALYFISLWLFSVSPSIPLFLLCCLTCGLALSSSKFNIQVVLFFTLLLSMCLHSLIFLTFLVFGYLLSELIHVGTFYKKLQSQAIHLKNYYHKLKQGNTPVKNRNRISHIINTFNNRDWGTLGRYFLYHDSLFWPSLQHLPLIIILLVYVTGHGFTYPLNTEASFPLYWGVSALIVWGVTSIHPLTVFGEAERYLFYAFIPEYLFLGTLLRKTENTDLMFLSLLIYSVVFWAGQVLLLCIRKKRDVFVDNSDFQEVINYLKTVDGGKLLPIGPGGNKFFYRFSLLPDHTLFKFDQRFGTEYNTEKVFNHYKGDRYVSWKTARLLDCDILILDKTFYKKIEGEQGEEISFSNLQKLYENDQYSVWNIQRVDDT